MRKIFSLLAAVLFAGSMMADPIVINASDVTTIASGATSGLDVTLQGINIVWQGAYYNSDGGDGGSASVDFRVYADKSMTLTAESNISKVEIAGYCKAGLTVTANAGTITTGASYASETTKGTLEDPLIVVDEIGATSVTLTCTKQMRAYIIRVTLAGGEVPPTPAVATPVISGEAEFTDSVIVTIACSTPETDIYYTTDGTTDPKCDCAAAPEYKHEIVLKETTTIMAAAYTGNDWSAVATKTFTKVVPPVNLGEKTIAEFLTLKNVKDTCILTGVVDSIKNTTYGNLYLSDATGQVYVYGVLNAAGQNKKFAELGVDVKDTLTIKAIYSEFNNAPQVKNGIFVSVKKAQGETPAAEWTEIVFNEAVAADDLTADASFEFEGLHVAITDSENKMAIDANNAYFGTADEYTKYAFRLKTGGKSQTGTKQNFITLNVPEDGLLRLAVRAGNGTDSTRTLVLAQGNDTLYNAIVKDADAIEVAVNDSTKIKVFPYVTVPVKAGNVDVAFPENSLNFYSFAFQLPVVPPTPVVAQYEVAEAIAAGLKDNDELFVHGVITKLEFKGTNFAKYGSVNIYVKDATGAEGEFEFYNCYSLNADTFRTSVPNYDPQSSNWAQFREVADENGNTIHVGDTVVAFGKYKLFKSTHELNTGCYLTEIKHAPVVPADTIEVKMTEGLTFSDNVATEGWWEMYGANDKFIIELSNKKTTQLEGTYTYEDLDPDYAFIGVINGTDTTEVNFVDGAVILSKDAEQGTITIKGALIGEDGNVYNIELVFSEPKPTETVTVNIRNAVMENSYAAYGLYGIYGYDENNVFVMLSVWAMEGLEGQYTEQDLDFAYLGSGIMEGKETANIYKAAITITPGNGDDYLLTATLLCYNNKQYNVTMYIPAEQGIEDVEATVKAFKRIVNGQVIIEKNGVQYNVLGNTVK